MDKRQISTPACFITDESLLAIQTTDGKQNHVKAN